MLWKIPMLTHIFHWEVDTTTVVNPFGGSVESPARSAVVSDARGLWLAWDAWLIFGWGKKRTPRGWMVQPKTDLIPLRNLPKPVKPQGISNFPKKFCKRSIRLRLVLVGSVSKEYPPGNCPNISPDRNGTFELLVLTAFRLVGYAIFH